MRPLLLLSVLLVGCPPAPIIRPPVIQPDVLPCVAPAVLTQADVCDGFFTVDGLACARCKNVKSCVDSNVVMYCASGPCNADPRCTHVKSP